MSKCIFITLSTQNSPQARDSFYSHFTAKQTEDQRGQVSCLRPAASNSLEFEPGQSSSGSRWCSDKEFACQCRRHKRHSFSPWVGKILWRRKWQPTTVFLSGKFHGQKSLVGYSPRGFKGLDTTERLSTLTQSCSRDWLCWGCWLSVPCSGSHSETALLSS